MSGSTESPEKASTAPPGPPPGTGGARDAGARNGLLGRASKGRFTFRTEIRNVSAWPIEIVWENAQDLEHVAILHRRTNYGFELLDVTPARHGWAPYESMIFMVKRKLFGVVPIVNFGFRRIVGPREIWQVDINPTFNVTTALWSTLERHPADPARTVLVDRLEITGPRIMRPFVRLFERALRRHTRMQCLEDESFRARRFELRQRGIDLPPSILNQSFWERTFGRTDDVAAR
jgi:hypothetical protein